MRMNTLTKSQQLLYYIIKSRGHIEDKTKLAKLQYFSDFVHYAFNNSPISEDKIVYTKQKQGPLALNFDDDLTYLKTTGLVKENPKYNYKVIKDYNIQLSNKEKSTIDYILNKYGNLSWLELKDIAHSQAPYLSAMEKSVIEFFTAYNLVDDYPDYPTKH